MRSCMGICLALLCVALGGYCGQMSSHVYTALQAKDGLTGAAAAVVTAREDAYLAGAQGPDVVGVVMPGLDKLSGWNSAGTESHYHPKKAELALNLLEAAGTDPAARAYAIGWISHYVNDIHVHELVNRYGGYYAVDETQHKVLEQLETKHVLVAHADVVTKARAEQNYAALGDTFAAFIINAYRATFPENALYKIENTNYFCRRFNEAAGYCTDAHKVFYATATTKAKNGNHGWGMATLKFPNMPTFDDYELMLRGMEITDVKPGKDRLTAVVKMHDTKCYGRFLADWEMAANAAIARTRAVYGLISAYLDATDPAVRAAARARLLAAIPAQNLDQPLATFDHAKAVPGNRAYQVPYFTCAFTPMEAPDAVKEVAARRQDFAVAATRWEGTEDGAVTLDIAVPPGAFPYEFTLNVATISKDDFAQPAYRDRSWATVSGSSDTVGTARVTVGEIFTVALPLTPALLPLQGTRVWVITDEEPGTSAAHLPGKIKSTATAFTVSRENLGKLPGNQEFLPQLGSHRYDVRVLEERLEGNVLTSRLQLSDPALGHHLGPQQLACVFLTRPQASSSEYNDAYRSWQAANQKVKGIWEQIEAKIEALSEAKRQQLEAEAEAYLAELEKQGLSEAEIEKRMERKFFEMLPKIGVTLTPEQRATIDAERAADAQVQAKSTAATCAVGKLIVHPCRVTVQIPEGWKEGTVAAGETLRRTFSTETITRAGKDEKLMVATGTMTITCADNPALEKRFMDEHARHARTTVIVGPLTGARVVTASEANDDTGPSRTMDCLLKSGALLVRVQASIHARGYRVTDDQGRLIADGTPAAEAAIERLSANLDSLLGSLRLTMGPIEAKTK